MFDRRSNRPSATRRPARLATVAATVVSSLLMLAGPAAASGVSFSSLSLTAVVKDRTITATSAISASAPVRATVLGICARNSSNGMVDFPSTTNVTISRAGTTITTSRTLSPGSYTYFACAKINGGWPTIGPRKTFIVPAILRRPTTMVSANSGQPMPRGNLPGWRQVFADDFTTNVAAGTFPGPYAAKWDAYSGFPDTAGDAIYSKKIISAHNGNLDLYLHTENGKALGAAPVPLVGGKWRGQIYGRFSVRFRSDYLPNFGTGWLLWPDSNNWNEGEIDFPEGSLSQVMSGYVHCPGHAQDICSTVDPGTTYYQWHTATIEWRPQRVSLILDGKTIHQNTRNIPVNPLHWVLQTGSNGGTPNPKTAGHVLIDWVAIYAAV